jgi:GNAT superfamily N-acetyltransferase
MIRDASHKDIPAMLVHCQAMHAESRYRILPFDADKVAGLIDYLIGDKDSLAIVYEQDGEILGGFLGGLIPHFCSPAITACDYGLFVAPDRRGMSIGGLLLAHYVAWAKAHDAAMISVGVTTNVNRHGAAITMQSAGFVDIGTVFEYQEKRHV